MLFPVVDSATPPRILVVGDLMLDRYFWGTCERISPEAPVQVVAVSRETVALGGAGNVVANLATLGAEVSFVAIAGSDFAASAGARLLESYHVGQGGLVFDPTRMTTIKTRVVASHQQIVRFDIEQPRGASKEAEDALIERIEELVARSAVAVLSDYAKGVLTPRVTTAAIAACRRAAIPVLVDPKGSDYSKYRGATLLTPNRREASTAAGVPIDGPRAVAAAAHKLLADVAIESCLITLGEGGMALFHDGQDHRLATLAREVFDVTGAGDTVIAAVAFALAAGLPLLDACHFANRAAGVVVGKLGSATVTLDEIRASLGRESLRLADKVVSLETALAKIEKARRDGRKIVFTNGCFDILHAGHVQYLAAAAALGDLLVVGLNSDDSARRLKGTPRPINAEEDRSLLLAALSSVDMVVTFGEDTPLALIQQIKPDVLVKGGDYRTDEIVGADIVRNHGGVVQVLPFVEGRSTSTVIERILVADRKKRDEAKA